jgi:hypothetical protein
MNVPRLSILPHSRKRFLRGLGAALALPSLELFSTETTPKKRMLLVSNNLGVLPWPFFPKESGRNYTPSPYLKPLQDFRDQFTVFSGLSHPAVSGGHSTENCFLTAAKDPTGSGFRNTISLDQYAIEKLGQRTRFPTLNLGVNIDKANRSLSWTRDGSLLPAEDKPSTLFSKMFVQGNAREKEQRLLKLANRESLLDALGEDLSRFQIQLGKRDKEKLDQYFTSIRELEGQLLSAGEWEVKPKPSTQSAPPADILDRGKFFEKFELMLRMAELAFESDSTRIVTLMVDGFATPVFEVGGGEKSLNGYHNLSHHGQSKAKIAQLEKVDLRQMALLRDHFQRLSDSKLLDDTMVLYGSNLGDANVHNCTNLPILLAGGGFQHGQHLAYNGNRNTPLANLFVSMLQKLGVEADRFSSGEGTLDGFA